MIKVELLLLRAVVFNNYIYYHLISGRNLPLFSQDHVHKFFDKNPNKIFLSMVSDEIKKDNSIADQAYRKFRVCEGMHHSGCQLMMRLRK